MDLFQEQPSLPATPDVFLLRQIVHDWPDKYAINILSHLRKVARQDTKLLIVDCVVDYACDSPLNSIPSSALPAPLLPNLGGANRLTYSVDVVVSSYYMLCGRARDLSVHCRSWVASTLANVRSGDSLTS